MKTVYYCGNPHDEKDSLPIKLIKKLQIVLPDYKFIHFDPTEDLSNYNLDKIIIIDSIKGIGKITIFDNLNNFALSPRISVHDYDLKLDLSLMLKLDKIKGYKIIGIPQDIKEETAVKSIASILQSI